MLELKIDNEGYNINVGDLVIIKNLKETEYPISLLIGIVISIYEDKEQYLVKFINEFYTTCYYPKNMLELICKKEG